MRIEKDIKNSGIELKWIQKYTMQKTPPWMFEVPQINVELKNKKGKGESMEIFRNIMQKYPNHDIIYTDGSKNDTATSSVALTANIIKKKKYNHYISINTAEALAIKLALEIIDESDKENFVIVSDSLSCLTALRNYDTENSSILDILEIYNKLRKNRKEVIFCWVPGHAGIEGNEKADKVAKEALEEIENLIRIPYRDLRPLIVKEAKQHWINLLEKDCNKIQYLNNVNTWFDTGNLIRKDEVLITRLHTGHTKFTHCFLLKGETAPICTFCNATQTINHILLKCNLFNEARRKYFCCKTIHELFSKTQPKHIINYIKDIQLYNRM